MTSDMCIRACVRCRPLLECDGTNLTYLVIDGGKKQISIKDKHGTIAHHGYVKSFSYDHVFDGECSQRDVFKIVVMPMLDDVLQGYNCTVLVYGQTGAGKTHTLVGQNFLDLSPTLQISETAGLIPRAVVKLFDMLNCVGGEYSVKVSFLQIYNEELFDLLSTSMEKDSKLRIYDDNLQKGAVNVQGLEEINITSVSSGLSLLDRGLKKSQLLSSKFGVIALKSHTMFSIIVHTKQENIDVGQLIKMGRLSLVGLAGCESGGLGTRVTAGGRIASASVSGTSGGNITLGLLTLSRVVTALLEHSGHIPYRESKLTRLLQNSIGGKTKTCILGALSPASNHLEESLATLEFLSKMSTIVNKPKANRSINQEALLKSYADEIERMKRDLQSAHEHYGVYIDKNNWNEKQDRKAFLVQMSNDLEEKIKVMHANSRDVNSQLEVNCDEIERRKRLCKQLEGEIAEFKLTLTHYKMHATQLQKSFQEASLCTAKHRATERLKLSQCQDLQVTNNNVRHDIELSRTKCDELRTMDKQNDACLQKMLGSVGDKLQSVGTVFTDVTDKMKSIKSDICQSLQNKMEYNSKFSRKMINLHVSHLAQHASKMLQLKQMLQESQQSHTQSDAQHVTLVTKCVDSSKDYVEIHMKPMLESGFENMSQDATELASVLADIKRVATKQNEDLKRLIINKHDECQASIREQRDKLVSIIDATSTQCDVFSDAVTAMQNESDVYVRTQIQKFQELVTHEATEMLNFQKSNTATLRNVMTSSKQDLYLYKEETNNHLCDLNLRLDEAKNRALQHIDDHDINLCQLITTFTLQLQNIKTCLLPLCKSDLMTKLDKITSQLIEQWNALLPHVPPNCNEPITTWSHLSEYIADLVKRGEDLMSNLMGKVQDGFASGVHADELLLSKFTSQMDLIIQELKRLNDYLLGSDFALENFNQCVDSLANVTVVEKEMKSMDIIKKDLFICESEADLRMEMEKLVGLQCDDVKMCVDNVIGQLEASASAQSAANLQPIKSVGKDKQGGLGNLGSTGSLDSHASRSVKTTSHHERAASANPSKNNSKINKSNKPTTAVLSKSGSSQENNLINPSLKENLTTSNTAIKPLSILKSSNLVNVAFKEPKTMAVIPKGKSAAMMPTASYQQKQQIHKVSK